MKLDDNLEPLGHGVWEVAVPKGMVTDPMQDGWKKSAINLPSPGTVASYRKGQYHAHETATEWRVHLDRYDPAKHPVLHLVDDAPLVMMIVGTFITLIQNSRSAARRDTATVLEEQRGTWRQLVLTGCFMLFVGALIALEPLVIFESILVIGIPVLIMGLALIILRMGICTRPVSIAAPGRILLGLGMLALGAVALLLPIELLAVAYIFILAIWAFSSAIMSLKHRGVGGPPVPPGLPGPVAIGVLSLLLSVFMFVDPFTVTGVLIYVLAVIALLFGASLILQGLGLRTRMTRHA